MTKDKQTDAGTTSLPGSPGAQPAPPTDPKDIQADIAATRAELGNTVADLSAKADVKARAQQSVEAAKERTIEAANQVGETVRRRPGPLAAIGVAAVAVLSAVGIRKRRAAKADSRRWWHKLRRG